MSGPSIGAVAAVVLAGGESRRYGSDKTRAELDGRPVLTRVVDVVAPLVDEVLVVGPWAPAGSRHDLEPVRFGGPLAALAHGLDLVDAGRVLVVGGDHPLVRAELLQLLLDRLTGVDAAEGGDPVGQVDAVVAVRDGRPEPLVAAYHRGPALASARLLLAAGERRLGRLLDELVLDPVPEATWRTADADGRSFRDVDTRADLAAIQRLLDPDR